MINTPQGRGGRTDGEQIRKAANTNRVSSVTTVDAALAAVQGMAEQQPADHARPVQSSLQEFTCGDPPGRESRTMARVGT